MVVSGITAPVPHGGMGFTYDPVYGPLYYFRGQYYSPDQVQSYDTSEAGTSYDGVIQGATPFAPTQQTATMGQAPSGYMTLQQAAATKGGGRPEAPQNRFDIYEREGWAQLLPQLGFQGQVQSSTYTPDESVEGGMRESFGLTPEAQSFIDNLKQQGYQIVADKDKVWSGSKYTTRLGLADPQGNILSNWEEQEGSYFDQLGPMLAAFAPAFFGIGNAIASGAVGGGANALAGAGIGGIEGAAFADLAAGMLPEFGTNAAYSAGLSGGTGLGGALTLQDIGIGIDDVLGAASEASDGAGGAVDVGGALDMADPEIAKLVRQGEIAKDGGSALAGIGPGAAASAVGSADVLRELLYGKEAYGPGMTGAQTAAYDSILDLTGSKTLADLAGTATGLTTNTTNLKDLAKSAIGIGKDVLSSRAGLAGLGALLSYLDKQPARGGGYTGVASAARPTTRTIVPGEYGPIVRYAANGGLMQAYAQGGVVTGTHQRPMQMEDGGFVMTERAVKGAGGPQGIAQLLPDAKLIRGPGTGTSDDIPATIEGNTPARVSNGEMYVPRARVKQAGGAPALYALMNKLQRRA